jgi:hypothetical protein
MKKYEFFSNPAPRYVPYHYLIVSFTLLFFFSCSSVEESKPLSDLERAKLSFEHLLQDPGNIVISFPEEDPGIPTYARVGPILNQFLVAGDKLVIPFYRNPQCIPENFNLMNYYDPPAAFGCELMVNGRFVIEKDAEEGQFPIMVYTTGANVPIWIVNWDSFQSIMANGPVTITALESLDPVKATAHLFEEYLSPRINQHQVIIEANGIIADTDQKFLFKLNHKADQIHTIVLEIE